MIRTIRNEAKAMVTCGILAEDVSQMIPPPKTNVITDDIALETHCTEILPPTT